MNGKISINDIVSVFNSYAPFSLQESYDNSGLICGSPEKEVSRVLLALDCTESVIQEAIDKKCELVISHHPILFRPIKSLSGRNYVERTLITAIKNDIAILAIHTNIDNIILGVNRLICEKLALNSTRILQPKKQQIKKLEFYVPPTHKENVLQAIFAAGCGNVGNYSECCFSMRGLGTFKPEVGSNPFSGEQGKRSTDEEEKVETIFPYYLEANVLAALRKSHPYEEIAYSIIQVDNILPEVGSGMVGTLPNAMPWNDFITYLKQSLEIKHFKHTAICHATIEKVAVCGGAGSFLIEKAAQSGAQVFITSDVKYHEYFDADGRIILVDIGHYESEKFTPHLFHDIVTRYFPNIATHFSNTNTNPVFYA